MCVYDELPLEYVDVSALKLSTRYRKSQNWRLVEPWRSGSRREGRKLLHGIGIGSKLYTFQVKDKLKVVDFTGKSRFVSI